MTKTFRHPIVALALVMVVMSGLGISVGIILRPFVNANYGPEAKLNLLHEIPLEYNRTTVTHVWKQGGIVPPWRHNSDAPYEDGYHPYVAYGCASCHGLDAKSGVTGGAVAGLDEDAIRAFVRLGPGGMPAYTQTELPDAHLDLIAAWINSQT